MLVPESFQRQNGWDPESEDPMWLLTPQEMDQLDPETEVHSILGETYTAGHPKVAADRTTRFGYLAYGLRQSQFASVENGFETTGTSLAKDHAYDAIEKELEAQDIDPYSEHADQRSPDLISLADAVVERLLKEGIVIPASIRRLYV